MGEMFYKMETPFACPRMQEGQDAHGGGKGALGREGSCPSEI